jgi:hypothetical protein
MTMTNASFSLSLSLCTRVTRTTTATLLHQPESAMARPINYKPFLFMNYSNQASLDPAATLVGLFLLLSSLENSGTRTRTRTLASSACPFVGELLCTGMLQRWIKASTNYDSCRQRYNVLARVQNKPYSASSYVSFNSYTPYDETSNGKQCFRDRSLTLL